MPICIEEYMPQGRIVKVASSKGAPTLGFILCTSTSPETIYIYISILNFASFCSR